MYRSDSLNRFAFQYAQAVLQKCTISIILYLQLSLPQIYDILHAFKMRGSPVMSLAASFFAVAETMDRQYGRHLPRACQIPLVQEKLRNMIF